MGGFSVVSFEEFAACGYGVEEVFDRQRRPNGHTVVPLMDQFAAVDQDFRTMGWAASSSSAEGELGNGSDRWKGFAAKAEAGDAAKVVRGAEFAGGVALESEASFVRGHAMPIVFDADVGFPPVLKGDSDLGSLSVEAVFDEFFDNSYGTFDHLSSGDLVDYSIGQ